MGVDVDIHHWNEMTKFDVFPDGTENMYLGHEKCSRLVYIEEQYGEFK